MEAGHASAPFEVIFRGSDVEEPLQMTEFPASASTDTSDLEAVSLSTGKLQQLSPSMSEPTATSDDSHIHQLEEESPLRETHSDPFRKPRWWREASSLSVIIASMIIFCFGITVALIVQIIVGSPQLVPHAGILSDDNQCSRIGIQALIDSSTSSYETASTVDVAILTALCLIVKNPHKGGLGGGGFMLIEKQHDAKKDVTQIDFREQSPNLTDATLSGPRSGVTPGSSVAIPGFIKGMHVAHKELKLGTLKWESIFELAAELALGGVKVEPDLAASVATLNLTALPSNLKQLLTKDDNVTKIAVNDTLVQRQLADTFKAIGKDADDFYTGALAQSLVDQLRSEGSKITMDDLANYKAIWNTDTQRVRYANMSIATGGPPSSGPVILAVLKSLSEKFAANNTDNNLLTHRLLEALKYAYGAQAEWGDAGSVNASFQTTPLFQIDDDKSYAIDHYLNGTQPLRLNSGGDQHVTVIGEDGLIVTIVIGIGSPFGSKLYTSGYLLNNAMLDFCWPGKNPDDDTGLPMSEANRIAGGKRPMSAMAPVLVLPPSSKCGLYLAFDAHEGTTATSAILQMITKKASGMEISESISSSRLNQDMVPYRVQAEDTVSDDLVSYLKNRGHNITKIPAEESLGVCNALSYLEGKVKSYIDPRDDEDEVFVF